MLLLLCGLPVQAEQYRSKLLLNPQQALTESAKLSIRELESQFKTLDSDYSRASVGSQLARHFVQQGEYQKAIEYYRAALQADALSPIIAADLRRELAEIYLLDKQPQQALAVLASQAALSTQTDPKLVLTYGRIHYELGNYLDTAEALELVMQLINQQSQPADQSLLQRVVALAYGVQDFALCGRALKQLIERYPSDPKYWSQMVSVLLKQNKSDQALHYLMLARQLGLLRDESNTLLLSSLYVAQGNPFAGAALLQRDMDAGIVSVSGAHYRTLFEYWWQAREEEKALAALAQAAQRTGEEALYLFWAQVLLQQSRWHDMHQVILSLCETPVAPKSLGQANLLLGIALYEQGKKDAAFKAFASATFTGGVNTQAGNWLQKLTDEGVQVTMPQRPTGPCQSEF